MQSHIYLVLNDTIKMHQELIVNYGDSYILYQSTTLPFVYRGHYNGIISEYLARSQS